MRALAPFVAAGAVAGLGLATPAAAQPDTPASPTVAPAPPAPSPPPPAFEPRLDAGWQLYHDAFAALLGRQQALARALTTRLLREHPGHPAARAVERSRVALGIDGRLDGVEDVRPLAESPSKGARAELALFQGIHGIYLGVELALLVEADDAAAYLLLGLGGGLAGGLVALEAVPEVTSGKRALLNSGTIWGAANAGLLLFVVDPDSDSTAPYVLPLMAGQLGGLALGASLFSVRPTAGQVGLANSSGQWAAAITAMVLAGLEPDIEDKSYALAVLAAMDGGLGVGAYLASRHPYVSRAQTLVIDAGGIFGAVAGGGVAVLIDDDFDRPALLGAALGAAAGLGVATYLTRNWSTGSDRDEGATTYLAPAPEGRGAVVGAGWSW